MKTLVRGLRSVFVASAVIGVGFASLPEALKDFDAHV